MTIYSLDDSFSYLEPVSCSMSSSNCCFLTCIQISQEACQVVWHSHLSQNFPQFIVIHTVKVFGTVNKTEIDVFLEFSCFFHSGGDGFPVELFQILKDDAVKVLHSMPANLENSAVATGLEKVSFHSNSKERQCQGMLKLPHNCTHLTR